MEVSALTKYARMSPKKVRDVARSIQGRPASEALDTLRFIPRKSARLIAKTLRSAMANAENNHNLSSDSLFIKSAIIEQGAAMRRFRPTARGQAHPYRKRSSHIKIVLEESK